MEAGVSSRVAGHLTPRRPGGLRPLGSLTALPVALLCVALWAPDARGGGAGCFGVPTTILGDPQGDDVTIGTPNNDVINTYSGDDVIDGGGGNDLSRWGQGNDGIGGGEGDDRRVGGDGGEQ